MIRPEYEELDLYLKQLILLEDKVVDGQRFKVTPQHMEMMMDYVNKYPVLKDFVREKRKEGLSGMKLAKEIYYNLEDLSDARKNKWKDGDFIHVGRPKKAPEEKAKRKKAERYTKIKDIKGKGTIKTKDLKNINYNDIKNLNTKEAQRIAYYLKDVITRKIRALHKAGLEDYNAERAFKGYGGMIGDIRTASLNKLKGFIRRGVNFLRSETSNVQKAKGVVEKVISKTSKATKGSLNLKKVLANEDKQKLFFGAVKALADANLGSLKNKEDRYRIWENVESYLTEGDADMLMEDTLEAYVMKKLDDLGYHYDTPEEMREGLNKLYDEEFDDSEYEY